MECGDKGILYTHMNVYTYGGMVLKCSRIAKKCIGAWRATREGVTGGTEGKGMWGRGEPVMEEYMNRIGRMPNSFVISTRETRKESALMSMCA